MCKDAAVSLVHLSLSCNMKLPKHMLVVSDYASVTQKNTKAFGRLMIYRQVLSRLGRNKIFLRGHYNIF